ncbi:hypothetical protein ACIF8T_40180 [Streptomyces sp. NPDC085946]|uniref:hypothetical protein n=1 Tax=Streptomyces sp. NPDC085946 TaxID=3365744 RepID=UPI0037D46DF6
MPDRHEVGRRHGTRQVPLVHHPGRGPGEGHGQRAGHAARTGTGRRRGDRLGALRSPALRVLLAALVFLGATCCWPPCSPPPGCPLLAPPPALAVLALTLLPGTLFVPPLTVAGLTLTALAPRGCSTEAVGWMSSAIRLGLATGTALAGALGGHFALPLLAAALCTLLLTARPTPAPASA